MLLRLALSALLLTAARAEESHWAYTPPQAREIPTEAHPVDTLLKDAWQKADLEPAPLAPPSRWLERAAYTLTGLPPRPGQLQRLAASPDEATWKALLDDLHATILHLLGFNHEELTYHYSGRDFRLTDVHGKVIHDIVA